MIEVLIGPEYPSEIRHLDIVPEILFKVQSADGSMLQLPELSGHVITTVPVGIVASITVAVHVVCVSLTLTELGLHDRLVVVLKIVHAGLLAPLGQGLLLQAG